MGTEVFYGWQNDSQPKKLYLYNTIITGSYRKLNGEDYITTNESDKIFYSFGDNNKANVAYSAIEGSSDQSWVDVDVFDIVPVYVDTAGLDYSLSIKSPVIGQGTSSYEGYTAPTVDILGNTRPSPSGSSPDMGAYENSLSSSPSPLPVTSLAGTSKTNSAYLSWTEVKASLGSSSNAANIKYLIYQGDSQVASSVSTSYIVTNLTNGTAYSFKVAAQDTSSGETGANSKSVSVTPKYRGPKWYVAASDGSALADTSSNADLGGVENPINHLTSAIEIASAGDTIVMQKGTHTGSSNRGIDWNASKSLVIMGDPNYTAESIIIDASAVDRHFKFDSGEDSTYQVIGLTLYNGKKTDSPGGSVYIYNNSSPVFRKVIFKENTSISDNWEGGGAVNIGNYSTPAFYNCIFDGNVVDRTDSDSNNDANGGAVFANSNSNSANMSILFDGCIFKNNMAKSKYGARAGAIFTSSTQVSILNCLFYGNTAYSNVGGTETRSVYGAAIYVQSPAYWSGNDWVGGYVKIVNSTIVNNLAKSGSSSSSSSDNGALYLYSQTRSEKAWIFNNIVWGNKSASGSYENQVYFGNEDGWSGKYLNYNVVQNSSNISHLQDAGSFEADPAFADSANGDYSLSNASQLIGKGGSSLEGVSAPTTDILGLLRPNPAGSKPDIGAYENSLSISPYPTQVENLTAVISSQSVTLSWDANASADSVYKVYKHTSTFSVAATYFIDTTSKTTYTVTGLTNRTPYYFQVSAVNKQGYEGYPSGEQSGTPVYKGPWYVAIADSGGTSTNEGSKSAPFLYLLDAVTASSSGDTI
ncbi:MAG: fibronectin type III domain-containing protein, partial [Porticoccaceae bacterium]|nr:fibronectin type III domain-containing protein [Porticoccaceae bacterium]